MDDTVWLKEMTNDMYHAFFREYENDPDIYLDKSAYTAYIYNEETVNKYIQRQIDLNRLPFAIMHGDEIIGELKLYNIEPRKCATLGIALKNARFKDLGYGSQAERLAVDYVFNVLDIPTLYADSVLTNTRSQHVLEKVGFQFIRQDEEKKYYRITR